MAEAATNTQGTLERPKDAGDGDEGLVARWVLELDQADRREQHWRKRAKEAVNRFRDESEDGQVKNRTPAASRFNILWANTSILQPKLYNSTPRPDVRRRFKRKDPLGKRIAGMIEAGLSYCADEHDVDQEYKLAVKDYLLAGRGLVRVRYLAEFDDAPPDGQGVVPIDPETGKPEQVKVYETVLPEHWAWSRFRLGPADKWSHLPWMAFQHLLTRDECIEAFGEKMGSEVPLDITGTETDDQGKESETNTHGDIFKLGCVWEIWDKSSRKVYWIAPSYKDKPIDVEDDPLDLENFWPMPRPLYSIETSDTLVPVEEYRQYRDQAEELDRVTQRIQIIVKGLKVRGIYAATMTEFEKLVTGDDNTLIPSESALAAMQNGGIDKAIWMMPIREAAEVLQHLYQQREQIKQVIYELTGLSDIMRGSSDPNETLGAQQLKAQSGGLRMSDRQAEVQRFIRDIYRIESEIMAEQFGPESWEMMTGVRPDEQMLQIMRNDKSRGFRIDIETDSTVALDQQKDEENSAKIIDAIAGSINAMVPAIQAGVMTKEMVLGLLMPVVRRAKMGREVEDMLDAAIGDGGEGEQQLIKLTPEQFEQEKQMLQQQAMEQAQAQAQEGVANEKAAIEAGKKQLQADLKTAQIELTAREKQIELSERELGIEAKTADQSMERRALDLGVREAMADARSAEAEGREVDVSDAEKDVNDATQTLQAVTEAIAQLSQAVAQSVASQAEQNATILAALSAPKEIVKDENGRPIGVRTQLNA